MISLNKIQDILKTLPIGYYLGYKIDAICVNSKLSYYDPMNDRIVIGYKQLPLNHLSEDDPEVEDMVRCMLYHEISHVILTPKRQTLTDIQNIFEDQRIETLLKRFYLRVDFKEFVKKVNNYKPGIKPETPRDYFYKIVRFNEGPKEFVKRVYEIIYEFKYVNNLNHAYFPASYSEAIEKLYNDIGEDFYKRWPIVVEKVKETTEETDEEDLEETTTEETTEETAEEIETSEKEKPEETNEEETNEEKPEEVEVLESRDITTDDEEESEDEELTEEQMEEISKNMNRLLKGLFGRYSNEKMSNRINTIIENAQRKKRNRGAAIRAYSGKLNPKRIARPGHIEDYKWFEKEARKGDFNRFDKTQLNLFCDVSGSFSGSETKINELIKCLIKLEKKNQNFKFKLIAMGNKNRIVEDSKRFVSCCEGNYLTNDILDIYKKVQTPNTTIYNIVVFDGDAQSFDGACGSARIKLKEENQKAWSAWNHQNCVIISDNDNKTRLDKGSPNAKRIYTKNYTEELENNIMIALGLLVK